MQNSKLVKHHCHSEGVKRLWESPAVSLMRYKGDCHGLSKPRNDGILLIIFQINTSNRCSYMPPHTLRG